MISADAMDFPAAVRIAAARSRRSAIVVSPTGHLAYNPARSSHRMSRWPDGAVSPGGLNHWSGS